MMEKRKCGFWSVLGILAALTGLVVVILLLLRRRSCRLRKSAPAEDEEEDLVEYLDEDKEDGGTRSETP